MNDYTPDSLRALPVVAWSKEWRDAYADAWEADIDAWDDNIIAWCDVTVERNSLRKLLEEAQADNAALRERRDRIEGLKWENAALRERLESAEKLSRTVETMDVRNVVEFDGHRVAGIEWATWTWLKEQIAALKEKP